MAKILGKEEQKEYTQLNVEDMTEEQIIALAKYTQLLQEENKNLKGYIVQLQAQLQNTRGNLAVANHHLQNSSWVVKTAFDE